MKHRHYASASVWGVMISSAHYGISTSKSVARCWSAEKSGIVTRGSSQRLCSREETNDNVSLWPSSAYSVTLPGFSSAVLPSCGETLSRRYHALGRSSPPERGVLCGDTEPPRGQKVRRPSHSTRPSVSARQPCAHERIKTVVCRGARSGTYQPQDGLPWNGTDVPGSDRMKSAVSYSLRVLNLLNQEIV